MKFNINGRKYRWNPMVLIKNIAGTIAFLAIIIGIDLALFTAFTGGF